VKAATERRVEVGITNTAWQRESRKETLWMLRERGAMLVQINISRFSLSLCLSLSFCLSFSPSLLLLPHLEARAVTAPAYSQITYRKVNV